jgi:endonuclease YncB( thermonuclease family)
MFPEELPRRLIRMFSFVGETVLDPFLGSGTTAKVAMELGRQVVGYEIQREFEPLIRQKLEIEAQTSYEKPLRFVYREQPLPPVEPPNGYTPRVQNARPIADFKGRREHTVKVTAVVDEHTLQMEDGRFVRLLGISVPPEQRTRAREYLQRYVQGRRVVIKGEGESQESGQVLSAYVYLTNRLFINRKMIEMGLAQADRETPHRYLDRFATCEPFGNVR